MKKGEKIFHWSLPLRCETEKTCGFCFFSEKQAELHFWSMHQEHVNPNMDQDGKPNKVTVTKTTSDKNHVEKVKNGHPDIKRSDTEVELPVDIH